MNRLQFARQRTAAEGLNYNDVKNKPVFSSAPLVLACFTAALLIDVFVYKNGYNWPPIRSDGFGYYLYLPAIFIHGDLFFKFLNDPAFSAVLHDDYYPIFEVFVRGDAYFDKFPVGTAIMQAPFFLGAWTIAKIRSTAPLSGFELPFQVANCISAAFYFAAGIYILFHILARRTTVLAASLCLLFAMGTTNILLYASYDGSFSHIYSFFIVSGLLAIVGVSDRLVLRSAGFGLLLGLAIIVRPTNAIAGLLWLQMSKDYDRTQLMKSGFVVCCGVVCAALPQMLIWFITTGNLIYYSYGHEVFNLIRPHIIDYLFSVRKGVFFWHPAFLLMILSLIVHYQKYRREALIFLAIIIANFYLGASWAAWYFGGSFGSRQTIDVLPVMVIASGSVFSYLATACRATSFYLCAVLTIGLATVNLVQMHGYIVQTIPFDETTWDIYKRFWMDIL